MNRYSVFSFVFLGIFLILFSLMVNGVSFNSFGRFIIILMIASPLLGLLSGLKGQRNFAKWTLITLNFIALCTISFLLLLGLGMGEA